MSNSALLSDYNLEIFNSECNPGAMAVHCFAHLKQSAGPALPYVNAVLGGFQFTREPVSVTFKVHGKLITIHDRKIAINALKDETEARKIVEWLIREINDAWEKRAEIEPSYQGVAKPQMLEILKHLPKTNCRECGEPTCMVFAVRATEGVKTADDCPALTDAGREGLTGYLKGFNLET